MLADDPLGTVEPVGAPSTKALVILMPLNSACRPADAG